MKRKWALQIVYAVILTAIVLGVSFTGQFVKAFVSAPDAQYENNSYAGSTTDNFSISSSIPSNYAGTLLVGSGAGKTWNNCVNQVSADTVYQSSFWAGWGQVSDVAHWHIERQLQSFDLTSIPTGSTIISAKIFSYQSVSNLAGAPSDWGASYFSWYKDLDSSGIISASDYSNSYTQGKVMVCAPKQASSYSVGPTSTWYSYTIYPKYISSLLSWEDSNHKIWFTFTSMRDLLNVYPSNWGAIANLAITQGGCGISGCYLQVSYATAGITRTVYIGTNAPINTLPTGVEVTNNITWGSPRCAYSDETIYFKVNGDSGANVTLKCIAGDGTLLAAQVDSVRTDGVYNWSFVLPTSYTGWIRAYEQNFGLYSTWGYVEKAPSPTMLNLMTYAHDTSYPQYDNPFSYYTVWKDGLMFVYWESNITIGEFNTYNLELWINGNYSYGKMFSANFTGMADSYYNIDYSSNRYLAAHRYAIFCPQIISSGYNNGNGLIYNLNQEYDLSTSGFIVPVIVSDTGTVITTCHTAYYYLRDSSRDGVVIGVDQAVEANKVVGIYIDVGEYSKIPDRLSNITIQIIDNDGNIYSTAQGSVIVGKNVAGLIAPAYAGSYQVRCTFYDSTSSPYYSLVLDAALSISGQVNPTATVTPPTNTPGGTSITDWTSWFSGFLKSKGLDNEGGHWLCIFLLCIVWVAVLHKNRMALTLMICITVGGALILRWLNPWFYVLLALGAAIFIYGAFKKKTSSIGED